MYGLRCDLESPEAQGKLGRDTHGLVSRHVSSCFKTFAIQLLTD